MGMTSVCMCIFKCTYCDETIDSPSSSWERNDCEEGEDVHRIWDGPWDGPS